MPLFVGLRLNICRIILTPCSQNPTKRSIIRNEVQLRKSIGTELLASLKAQKQELICADQAMR